MKIKKKDILTLTKFVASAIISLNGKHSNVIISSSC